MCIHANFQAYSLDKTRASTRSRPTSFATPVRPMAWLALGVYLSSCYCLGMAIHAEIDDDAKDQQKTREGKDQ